MNGPYEFDELMLRNLENENADNEDSLFKEICKFNYNNLVNLKFLNTFY